MSPRPQPPRDLEGFAPAPDVAEWARAMFIDEDAELFNEDHAHLRYAGLGFLWTSVPNSRGMMAIVGQAEFQPPNAIGRWSRARAEQQLLEWFGDLPDFLITLDAGYCASVGDAEFCATVEHELMHCGQARDIFGAPKFTRHGRPVFCLRGHDVEEFVGIVRRHGVGAAAGQTLALVEAAQRAPEIAAADIRRLCGTCLERV